MEWKKSILYTGIAASTGLAGYIMGRSKSIRGVSLTLMAVSMMLYLPRGCDLIDNYMKNKNEMQKYELRMKHRNDSIDNVITLETLRKDSIYSHFNLMIAKEKYKLDKIIADVKKEKNIAKQNYEDLKEEMSQFKDCIGKYYITDEEFKKRKGK